MPDSFFISDDAKPSQIWYKESGKQPLGKFVASIAVEYGRGAYSCKPIESSVT